jgi:hypothetical protein
MARRGTKPTEILLQAQKRSQKKSPRILLLGTISHDAMRWSLAQVKETMLICALEALGAAMG